MTTRRAGLVDIPAAGALRTAGTLPVPAERSGGLRTQSGVAVTVRSKVNVSYHWMDTA